MPKGKQSKQEQVKQGDVVDKKIKKAKKTKVNDEPAEKPVSPPQSPIKKERNNNKKKNQRVQKKDLINYIILKLLINNFQVNYKKMQLMLQLHLEPLQHQMILQILLVYFTQILLKNKLFIIFGKSRRKWNSL